MSSEDPPIEAVTPRSYSQDPSSFFRENGDKSSTNQIDEGDKEKGDKEKGETDDKESNGSCQWSAADGVGSILLWTAVIFIFSLIILVLFQPSFILDPVSGKVDYGKASLASIIIALSGVIIIWLIRSCSHRPK